MNKSMTSLSLRLSVVLLASTLGACSLIPTYERPAAPVAAQWPQAQPASPDAAVSNWQQYYPDPRLQGLIRQALADNRDMRVAILNIEQLRLGERLRVEWDMADFPVDALIPPLVLQPLLENAVYHGIEPRTEPASWSTIDSSGFSAFVSS